MNWLDIAIGGVLILSLIGAIRNGLTREVVRLLAIVAGIVGGMWWYEEVAAYYRPYVDSEQLAGFAGFGTILLGTLLAGMLIAWVLVKMVGWVGLRWFDRLLGGAFGLLRGMLMAAALVLAVVAFTPIAGSPETVADSKLAPWVLHGARTAVAVAPSKLQRAYSEGLQRVRAVWAGGPVVAAPPRPSSGRVEDAAHRQPARRFSSARQRPAAE